MAFTYLAPHVPHLLWVKIRRVCSQATGVHSGQLPGIVLHKLHPWRAKRYTLTPADQHHIPQATTAVPLYLFLEKQKYRERSCEFLPVFWLTCLLDVFPCLGLGERGDLVEFGIKA